MLKAEQILQERYQLKQKLGQNAGRQTWLAADLHSAQNPLVIVKLLAFGGEVQWDSLKLFEREAQVLQQLNHSQIPKYRDYFCLEQGIMWFALVQEYIPGASLKELLSQGKKFTEEEVRQIAIEVLNILIYLHEQNPPVLHRDIKPSNLIWGEDSQIYLVDFGAVQNKDTTEGATFTVVGSYGYTPMEQFGGRAVPASDLYALAMSLVHLLTDTSPGDLPSANLQIQFADRVSCSPSMVRWLQQLSEPALERRFNCARLALQTLESPAEIQMLQQPLPVNNSGQGGLFDPSIPVPEEIKGWNWGAFLMAPVWTVSNRVWMGVVAWVPIVGLWMAIALAIKGNEWAWKSRKWQSIEEFQAHQKKWAIAGTIFGVSVNLIFWQLGFWLLLSVFV